MNCNLPYKIPQEITKYILLFLPVLFIASFQIQVFASQKDSISRVSGELKAKALRFDRNNDSYNAIDYYRRYVACKPKDTKLTYRLATLYFNVRDYSKANQYFDSVLRHSYGKLPLAFYRKGISCMNLGKYDDAIDAFTRFRKLYKTNDEKYNYRKLAGIYIESSEWAKTHPETDEAISVTHPGEMLNHATIDFAPFPVDDHTILYGALFSDTSKQIIAVRQVYKAEKNDGHWETLGLLEGEVNSPEFNTGNTVISENGKQLFFTRTRKNWQNTTISELYVSHFENETWQTPIKLPYPVNDENYTSTQPALGKNLKTGNDILYFVSDRPGGKGGLDIWCTEYDADTKTYKEPVDLDKGVNTSGDECSPFYDMSGRTLYFSSRGRKNGFGGYDIYKAVGSSKRWTEAIPLPKPINSSYDDYYFSILKNNKEGFFTSNRPGSMTLENGSCCDDIFSFKINECVKISAFGTVRNAVNYDFYKHLNEKYHLGLVFPENNILLPDVPVELYLSGEKENETIMITKTTTNQSGVYHFELERDKHYSVLVKNYGYFEKRVPLNTTGINCSDTVNIGTTLLNYLPKVTVRVNIYYDHDKSKLTDGARKTIDSTLIPLFSLFPNAIVEIGSHTDSTGTDEYNMKLSQKRSESVVAYLVSKGISSDRLVAKGYGMSVPIAPNTNPDGSDNPAGRQLNRRTEIKIVGELNTFNIDE